MSLRKGNERLLWVEIVKIPSTDPFLNVSRPIAHLTENSFSEKADTMQTNSRFDEGGWRTFVPTTQSYSISFSGILHSGATKEPRITYEQLRLAKRNKSMIKWEVKHGATGYMSGKGYLVQISETASIDGMVAFSGTLEGYGEVLPIG